MKPALPLLLAAALVLGGCAVGDPYRKPEATPPAGWRGAAPPVTAWPEADWWKRFGSPELDGLIAEAETGNLDLRAAAARIAQARAGLQIAGANRYPQVTVAGDVDRSTRAGDGNAASTSNLVGRVGYEVDLWGGIRYGIDSRDAAVRASEFDREALRLTLLGDVAATYFQVLTLRDRLRVARDNLANAERLLKLVETRLRLGRGTRLEVERQRTTVAALRAAIPPLEQQARVAEDALAVLLGRPPQSMRIEAESLRPLALPQPSLGLPSELLERRPDIQRAEADLIAANADIGVARAALYPNLTLTGRGGLQGSGLSNLFGGDRLFWGIAAAVFGTAFDGGRLSGEVDRTRAREAELLENYRKTVLTALREVEDALAGVEQFALQEQAQQEAAERAREAFRLAERQFRLGAADYTTVLDAQRALILAEAAVDPVRLTRFTATVDLYRAAGGGWTAPAAAAAAASAP